MKAKDYIIIGGAVALFLLWKNKQKTKASTITKTDTTTGGRKPNAMPLLEFDPNKTFEWGTKNTNAGTSQVTSFPTPTSNEPEQVNGLGLPTGMDLPILTAGTGIPTEVAVQQGGVSTTPTPAITPTPPLGIEEGLELGGIKPIVKPFKPYSPIYETTELPSETTPLVMPRVKPTLYMAEF